MRELGYCHSLIEGPWDPVVAVYEEGSEEESVVEKGRALGTAETLKSIARHRGHLGPYMEAACDTEVRLLPQQSTGGRYSGNWTSQS